MIWKRAEMVINAIVLLFVAAVWALTFIFLKIEERTITPICIMSGRSAIAFAALLAAALISRKNLLGHLKDTWKFFVFSVLGITVLWMGLAFGQEYVTAGVASVIVTTTPLLTFVILVFILREEPFSFLSLCLGWWQDFCFFMSRYWYRKSSVCC